MAHQSNTPDVKPDLAETYLNRGIASGQEGDVDAAIQDFNKAIELNPQYARRITIGYRLRKERRC